MTLFRRGSLEFPENLKDYVFPKAFLPSIPEGAGISIADVKPTLLALSNMKDIEEEIATSCCYCSVNEKGREIQSVVKALSK